MGVGGQRHDPVALHPEKRPGTGGWVGLGAGLDGSEKYRPTRSQSLHRLSYPGRYTLFNTFYKV